MIPGEQLVGCEDFGVKNFKYSGAIHRLPVVKANHGLQLQARVDHRDADGHHRQAGEIWQFEGPLTYKPTAQAVSTTSVLISRGHH